MKKQVVLVLLLLMCTLLSACDGSTIEGYTNVLDDLKQSENFRVADYPVKLGDYSLQVIQIGESDYGELFLYVYQPSGKLEATSVNIAQEKESETGDTHNFKLELLSSSGTLFKYLVEGLIVRNTSPRYYDITSIYRAWDGKIDKDAENDNVIDEVVYEVAQLWTIEDRVDDVEYSMQCVETIEILNPYTNYVSYFQGYNLLGGMGEFDCHYVAFDTDIPMDDLLEASVSYELRTAYHSLWTVYGDWEPAEKVLKKTDVAESNPNQVGLFGDSYEFSRIVKTEDFLEKETLSDEAKTEVAKTKWVLRFVETQTFLNGTTASWIDVGKVTILRLKFQTDGVVYNMGAVMNKISTPTWSEDKDGPPWWVIVLIVLGILIVIGLVVKPVATGLVWIVKILWYIISAPFKFIVWLFSKGRR